jgi:hypothetical protein
LIAVAYNPSMYHHDYFVGFMCAAGTFDWAPLDIFRILAGNSSAVLPSQQTTPVVVPPSSTASVPNGTISTNDADANDPGVPFAFMFRHPCRVLGRPSGLLVNQTGVTLWQPPCGWSTPF